MGREVLYQGKFLTLIREGRWEYTERVRATGAAIVLAITPDNQVLLVEQYRIPVAVRTIELPAGIIGDDPEKEKETHEEAAGRELLEETGWKAGKVVSLTTGAASSGAISEIVTLFMATDLVKVHEGGGVEHEEITVHLVPVANIDQWLKKKAAEGLLIDPKIYAGLYFLGYGKRPGAAACS
jgi:ADP-ribose pyrophosphatase